MQSQTQWSDHGVRSPTYVSAPHHRGESTMILKYVTKSYTNLETTRSPSTIDNHQPIAPSPITGEPLSIWEILCINYNFSYKPWSNVYVREVGYRISIYSKMEIWIGTETLIFKSIFRIEKLSTKTWRGFLRTSQNFQSRNLKISLERL